MKPAPLSLKDGCISRRYYNYQCTFFRGKKVETCMLRISTQMGLVRVFTRNRQGERLERVKRRVGKDTSFTSGLHWTCSVYYYIRYGGLIVVECILWMYQDFDLTVTHGLTIMQVGQTINIFIFGGCPFLHELLQTRWSWRGKIRSKVLPYLTVIHDTFDTSAAHNQNNNKENTTSVRGTPSLPNYLLPPSQLDSWCSPLLLSPFQSLFSLFLRFGRGCTLLFVFPLPLSNGSSSVLLFHFFFPNVILTLYLIYFQFISSFNLLDLFLFSWAPHLSW